MSDEDTTYHTKWTSDDSRQDDLSVGGSSNNTQKQPEKKPKKKNNMAKRLICCAVTAAMLGTLGGAAIQGIRYAENKQEQESVKEDNEQKVEEKQTLSNAKEVSEVVDNIMPAIVAITNMTQTEVKNWFGQKKVYESESAGSGIIVSQDDNYLYIATNNHVVSGANTLTVCFSDETTAAAEIRGTDAGSDLAVIKVSLKDINSETANNIRVATLGNSDKLIVGEAAIAIGNALGYGQSVTMGVISALNREVSVDDSDTGTTVVNELIQTDAAINPGNSGGALINSRGEVIGINSVKYVKTSVEGVGYAIPIATARPIIEELISRELVSPAKSAYLGISGVDVTESVSATYGMPEGVYVAKVTEGSCADKAGIVAGDVITKFAGHKVSSRDELQELMQYYEAGQEVEIVAEVSNNGVYEEQTFKVILDRKN